MNNLIQKVKTKILKNKNTIIFVAFLLLLFSVDNAFAADNNGGFNPNEIYDTVIKAGNMIFGVGGIVIGILTQFVGLFLQPEWTTGSIIGLDVYLKQLWIFVSNIIYFIFAFLLIFIAFMNIIGKGDNSWQMKTALPHFIIGIIIVPFSWFIIQFVLSISAILTVSAISLPFNTFKSSGGGSGWETTQIPTDCTIDIDSFMGGSGSNNDAKGFSCTGTPKSIKEIMMNGDSLFSIMTVYSYGIMRIQDFDKLFNTQLSNEKKIGSLAINVIFNVIFVLRFLILLIALAIAMFSRGVVLWLFTIFSPIFGLIYFFNGKTPKSLQSLDKLSFNNFIGLAMVPVYVGFALSFGLLFTFVATQGLNTTPNTENKIENNHLKVAGSNLTISGSFLGSDKTSQASNIVGGITDGGIGAIAQLFIDLIALAVLWMAVMAALKSSEITGGVIAPIESFGKSIGQTAMKLPQYAPIFPGGQSMQGMQQIGAMPGQAIERKIQEKAMNSDIAKMFNPRSEKANDYERRRLSIIGTDQKSREEFIQEQIKKLGPNSSQQEKESFISALTNKNLGIDNKLLDGLRKNTQKEIDFRNEIVKLGDELGKSQITTPNNSFNTIQEVNNLIEDSTISDSPKGKHTNEVNEKITKTEKDGKININVQNITNPIEVKNGKIEDGKINDLISGFNKQSSYSEDGFKKILSDLGITDTKQQEKIWEELGQKTETNG